jgi:chemotaxis protein histidine kinase CheA
MSVDIMERMRSSFRAEALELLGELDTALLALEADPENGSFVHRVFRAIHTIKGSGATAGFAHLAAVAHKVEEAFDLARDGRLGVTATLIDCGLKTCDVLRAILGAENPDAECSGEREVSAALAELVPKPQSKPEPSAQIKTQAAGETAKSAFQIVMRPHRGLFYSGTDPITLLDELRALGQAHISTHTDDVPLFFDLEPESCYLWWEIRLVTERGERAVRDVFSFVEDDCDLTVRPLEDQSSAVALLGSVSSESLELFTVECQEHLETIEQQALALETDQSSRESLDALFRAVHSIKGNTGLLLGQLAGASLPNQHPLPSLAHLAHALESRLEAHREAAGPPVQAATVALVLETRDAMQGLLENLAGQSYGFVLPVHLLELPGHSKETHGPSANTASDSAFRNTAAQCLEIFENCLREMDGGHDSRATLKTYQRGLKTLASAAAYQKRSDLEEPVASQLRILDAALREGSALTAEDRRQLSECYQSARSKVDAASAAPAAVTRQPPSSPAASTTIRIDQEKLERLMRVVGELLVAKGSFPTLAAKVTAGEDRVVVSRMIKDTGASISHIAEELQTSVMAIRMLPVKTVFQRFPRLVRDLARSLGKEVQLVLQGETTELDKTILEQIGDPLVHLVRNAVDHGLEDPGQRERCGKSACGRLLLRAGNEAGNVLIQVEDDGRGLDAEALKRKAVEKGLISPEAMSTMSHAEACRLVFLPGLSTAKKVTEVSGRGVGMDVVRNNIRDLQGTVDIVSERGAGTTFSIKLPTSLIVSKGILLEASGQEYILPLTAIRDMVKIPAAEAHAYCGHRMARIRGEVYSLFSLADIFGLPPPSDQELSVAVIDSGKVRYGLIADRFTSEVEVLVKPLAGGLAQCREFHGAAIMGDGRVVLVLNPLECHRLEALGRQ